MESNSEKSYRVNGFYQEESSILDSAYRQDFIYLPDYVHIDESRVNVHVVDDIQSYLSVIDGFKTSYDYPLFYRAHDNLNHLNLPSSLRNEAKINKEDKVFWEFQRRCPSAFDKCSNTLEKLVVMQHYGSFSRCLDLTESPLIALAFACIENKKFPSSKPNKNSYASISVFQANNDEDIKPYSSNTVRVIANCAMCERNFKYGNIEIRYKNDGAWTGPDNFIYFRDILSRSVIVRTKQDNPRIANQKGAFILVNANELVPFKDYKTRYTNYEFTDYILSNSKPKDKLPLNLGGLKRGKSSCFGFEFAKSNEWDFEFRKVDPYNIANKHEKFRNDPFDLERLYFRDNSKRRVVFIISPQAKEKIRDQLKKLGITYDYLYPEIDTVFHEIVENI